ncbi:MAG: bifunctional phosphoribosylaminoimidazolecarboxamide formyltransferase/IMP cyclohydrolase [Opitutales bacterium]
MEKLALLSVSDKSGVVDFARTLVETHGFKLLSTGGTARALTEASLPVTEVSDHTGFPEMMEGRVKTLHPKIHGGLLAKRDDLSHLDAARAHGIGLIELVCVNLYPFEQTVAKPDCTFADAIENIDIGGPSMLRSAAKNHTAVTVVTDPADYPRVLEAMVAGNAELQPLRQELAMKVFQRTAAYDAAISAYLERQQDPIAATGFPQNFTLTLPRAQSLRYGENPHQGAALYGRFHECFEQLQGKELSYNNLIDISAAAYLIGEFEKPTVAILKHTNPCGVASSLDGLAAAWDQAFETDKTSPFGGIIVMNQTMDAELAERIREIFCEVIIAPGYTEEARAIFGKKKSLRLMQVQDFFRAETLREIKSVVGGVLVQDRDQKRVKRHDLKVVTERQPTDEEWAAMEFGWRVVKHVKSNAIVYAAAERTIGVGAGQMSRVDSSKVAIRKAAEAGLSLHGSVVCSDAFFPFPDGLVAAAEAGATAAIQPGGSVRDEEVIAAANERGVAMVFTGVRHFRH